jgi:hypothetical protein
MKCVQLKKLTLAPQRSEIEQVIINIAPEHGRKENRELATPHRTNYNLQSEELYRNCWEAGNVIRF